MEKSTNRSDIYVLSKIFHAEINVKSIYNFVKYDM